MTQKQLRNKNMFVNLLMSTATHHGKELSYPEAIDFANWLHRCEATLSRLAEDQCNYPTYDEKKQVRYEARVEKAIAERVGCKCYTQRDPRGFTIRLYLVDADGRKWFNTLDGETSGCNW